MKTCSLNFCPVSFAFELNLFKIFVGVDPSSPLRNEISGNYVKRCIVD